MNSTRAPGQGGTRPRLRTVYCTRGGLFGAFVLERLRASDRLEICAVVRSSRTFHPACGFLRGALALLRRSGIVYALYLFCVTTLADVLCGLSRIGRVPVRSGPKGTPVHTTRNINDAEGLRFLRDQAPDLIVSAFFDQRLHEAALSVPARGCLNIHPSLLPSFGGVDPVLQARLHRVAPIGVSVHYMTPELDAGEVLVQETLAVPDGASIFEATALLYRRGAELLAAEIEGVASGQTLPARDAPASYQSWPSRPEIRALHAHGSVLIRISDFHRLLTGAPFEAVSPEDCAPRQLTN